MPELPQQLRDAVRAVLEKRRFRLVYVFGSRARGDAGATSDLDVAVLNDARLDLNDRGLIAEELATATGLQVDLVDLADCPPLLRFEIAREGETVVCESPEMRLDFELQAVRDYEDTRYLRRQQQDLIREFVSRGFAA